jgi:hypothetical protein
MNNNKRRAKRRDLTWNVIVTDLDGSAICTCKTSNVSDTGTRLISPEGVILPDDFFVSFSATGAVKRKCKVVWRSDEGQEVGVKFSGEERRT